MTPVSSQPSRPLQYAKAIRESGLSSGVRATCWALATFADNDTGRAWPTVKTLARAAGLSEAVVSKHTSTAESMGYLRKHRRTNSSIIYTITIPVTDDVTLNLDPGSSSDELAPSNAHWSPDEQSYPWGQ